MKVKCLPGDEMIQRLLLTVGLVGLLGVQTGQAQNPIYKRDMDLNMDKVKETITYYVRPGYVVDVDKLKQPSLYDFHISITDGKTKKKTSFQLNNIKDISLGVFKVMKDGMKDSILFDDYPDITLRTDKEFYVISYTKDEYHMYKILTEYIK